jgi:DNA-binding response OmpR family regulator
MHICIVEDTRRSEDALGMAISQSGKAVACFFASCKAKENATGHTG